MKMIEVTHPIQSEQLIREDAAMAFGFFDGMYRGHSKVFEALDIHAKEKNLKKAATALDPHPSVILNPERKRTDYLTPLSDKLEIIKRHDIDCCIVTNFSSRSTNVTVGEFIKDCTINNHVKEVVTGFDLTFSKFDKENMVVLSEIDEFNAVIVGKLGLGSEKISTTSTRQALYKGNLRKANDELDYLYRIKGTVVQEEKRGRTIGFPTINARPSDNYVLPRKGVYAISIEIDAEHEIYHGVANVGVRPTSHDLPRAEVVTEMNIFDFKENIHGGYIIVYWHHYPRSEVKLSDIDALVSQMSDDKERVKYLLVVDLGDDVSYNI